MKTLAMAIVTLACAASCHAGSILAYDVTLNMTPLQGQSGYLAFDFLGGTPVESNTVTIDGFSSDSTLGTVSLTGGATGSLMPGPATLNDSQFFNELLQPVTFGTTAAFTLSFTTNVAPSGIPDSFSFFLLDSALVPYATSDPSGAGALITVPINQANLSPQVFTSAFASATVTPVTTSTPEPATGFYLVLGGIALAAARARRR
jgi:hypothetical protein